MINLFATSSFWFTKLQVQLMSPYTHGVVHTGRPFSYYRRVFFDNLSKRSTLAALQGKKLVDIGCGLTPFAADSMFRACYDAGVEFYGVDPIIKDNMTFSPLDSAFTAFTGGSAQFDEHPPGLNRAISGFANDLPFSDHEIDMIFCCWLVLLWIENEEELLNIFTEFHRVLKVGGTVNLYPLPDWRSFQFKSEALNSLLDKFSFTQHFIYEPFNYLYPPANRLTLKKIP